MMRFCSGIAFLVLILWGLPGCTPREDMPKVDPTKRLEPAKPWPRTGQRLRFAVGGMITPREGLGYYRKLLDYIAEKLGRPVDFVDREGYEEINRLIRDGSVDVGFVCGGPYVDGHRDFGMELLVAPVAYGKPVYYSYIIVPGDSTAQSFGELRGKSFAFTDPLSNSGTLVPTYMLARMGETPLSFFKSTVFSRSHDRSIRAVAEGMVDGAAVDSLVWEYQNRTEPAFTGKTRIIERSPPYGIPPVVATPGLDPTLKEQVRQVLLNAHLDPRGKEILDGMMIDQFVSIDDSAYDSIREMKAWIAKQENH